MTEVDCVGGGDVEVSEPKAIAMDWRDAAFVGGGDGEGEGLD